MLSSVSSWRLQLFCGHPARIGELMIPRCCSRASFLACRFMLGLASNPEMVRNVAIVGHLHHGKTSLIDMLVYETHKLDIDLDHPVRLRSSLKCSRRTTHVLTLLLSCSSATPTLTRSHNRVSSRSSRRPCRSYCPPLAASTTSST